MVQKIRLEGNTVNGYENSTTNTGSWYSGTDEFRLSVGAYIGLASAQGSFSEILFYDRDFLNKYSVE